ncbi:choice-of-anchor D domain-containing protein, partial [bacterium]|nr:choice-of-anchor D domain-containing protein [bacterium]
MQYLRLRGRTDRATVGIQDPAGAVGLTAVHDGTLLHEGMALEFRRPPSWLGIDPRAGELPPGDCTEVTLSFDATDVPGDEYDFDLVVESDDPGTPQAVSHVTFTVPGDPVLHVDPVSVDFGDVAVGAARAETLRVRNDGPGRLRVTALSVDHPAFTVPSAPFTLEPAATAEVAVQLVPEATGPLAANLSIESNDPASPSTTVPLTAHGRVPATIEVTPASFSASLFIQESTTDPVTIENHGEIPLEWTAAASFHSTPMRTGRPRAFPATRILWPRDRVRTDVYQWMAQLARDVSDRGAVVDEVHGTLTPELLAPYDILWLYDTTTWTDPEMTAVRDWTRAGGSVLFGATYGPSNTNRILDGIGSSARMESWNAVDEVLTDIAPHPVTVGVDSVFTRPYARFHVESPHGGPLVRDANGLATAAWEEIGRGRLVLVSEPTMRHPYVHRADNRRFGNRVFDWLAGPAWLSATPSSGTVPPGESRRIAIGIDAGLLSAGPASGGLYFMSNDPANPVADLRVDVTVADPMRTAPAMIAGSVFVGESAVDTLWVGNDGVAPLDFAVDWTRRENGVDGLRILETSGHGEGRFSTDVREVLEAEGAQVTRSSGTVTGDFLSQFDVVSVDGGSLWAVEEATALFGWIRDGGSVLMLAGGDSANHLLYVAGASMRFDRDAATATEWTYPVGDHELTAPYDSAGSYPSGSVNPLAGVDGNAQPLLQDTHGTLFAGVESVGFGRILAFSSDIPTAWAHGRSTTTSFGEDVFAWLGVPVWFTADPRTGTVAPQDSLPVVVTLGGEDVTPGMHAGALHVRHALLPETSRATPVTLEIGPIGEIEVVPAALEFGEGERLEITSAWLELRSVGEQDLVVTSMTAAPDVYDVVFPDSLFL